MGVNQELRGAPPFNMETLLLQADITETKEAENVTHGLLWHNNGALLFVFVFCELSDRRCEDGSLQLFSLYRDGTWLRA